jgi:hypothetical protein
MSRSPVPITVELPPELLSELRTGPARRAFQAKFTDDELREHMAQLGRVSAEARRTNGTLHEQMQRASQAAAATRRTAKEAANVAA